MRTIALIATVAALLPSAVAAATPPAPKEHGATRLMARIRGGTDTVLRIRHASDPDIDLYVDAWVNGQRLLGLVKAGDLYLVGTSSVVQCPVKVPPTHTFTCRATRTLPTLATLRLAVTW